ncbi:MAG: nucleotidyltransferase domain-containing protein [Magnetococcales bacterium]|nr:nucleotidyltransferase domain-containing protein [Magnetococcales bacterium]MBF0603233.1 nucleotidyltransferase domain-containing protein [Magnetococcales bacterium]HAT51301.1 DNA polymerase subunit beta [Alphaproteobacteria bacterium]
MIDERNIQQIGTLLAEAIGPSRIILFGSFARGDAREESDLDLLVVEPAVENRVREITRLQQLLRPLRIPVDLLVCSVAEMEERRTYSSGAIYWALQEGRIIHDSLG